MTCLSTKQMAPPNNMLLFVLFLFFHFYFSMSFTTNDAALISQVCSHTKNYDFCVQTLTSNPSAGTATLRGLDHISLTFTTNTAMENDDFIGKSLGSAADPAVKQVLEHCKANYENSMFALRQAASFLDIGDYQEVDVNTHIALGNTNDCDGVIKHGPPPPGLQDKNTKMLQLTDISIAIANLLVSS